MAKGSVAATWIDHTGHRHTVREGEWATFMAEQKLLTHAVRVLERRAVEELLKTPGEDVSVKATEIIQAIDAVRLNRPAYALVVQTKRSEPGIGYDLSVFGPWATKRLALKAKPVLDNIYHAPNAGVWLARFTNCMNDLEETL